MSKELALDPAEDGRIGRLIRQGLMALLTGGASLIWVLGRRVPTMWDEACITRAAWIQAGKPAKDWSWVAKGWLALLATILVALPFTMAITGIVTLAANGMLVRGVHLPRWVLGLLAGPSLIALFVLAGLLVTWLWHSARQALALAWTLRPWSH